MLKMGFFCSNYQNMFQKWTTTILNDIIPYFMHNLPFFHGKSFLGTPQEIDKIMSIQLEAGQI
jgi:hypothetical protein